MNVSLYILYFLFGAVIGSFSNMLVYRYVYSKPIFKVKSYCINCNQDLKWYNLIPIFSFIFQKGKCSSCKKPIHIRYLLLELFSALLFVFIMHNVEPTLDNIFFFFVLLLFLIPIIVIDVMIHLIYDSYLKLLILLTIIFLFVNQYIYQFNITIDIPTFKEGMIGLLVVYFGLLILNKIGGLLLYGDYRLDVLGGGDVKLLAWMMMLVGSYSGIMFVIFLSACISLVLFAFHQLLFNYTDKTKNDTKTVYFNLIDSETNKSNNIKVRLSKKINKTVFNSYVNDKILPFTFLIDKIDKEKNTIRLHNGKTSFNLLVDRDTIQNLEKDKEQDNTSSSEFYVQCQLKFDDNGILIGFEYDKISDYELYMQSMLRTKFFGSEGVPFAPGLIFGFLIFIVASDFIITSSRGWFFN